MAQFKTQNFTFFAPRTVIFCKKYVNLLVVCGRMTNFAADGDQTAILNGNNWTK